MNFYLKHKSTDMICTGAFYYVYIPILNLGNKKSPELSGLFQATTGFEPVIRVLQTHALPLGYRALVTPTRFELVLPP